MSRRLTPSLLRNAAVTITRASIRKDELVYVLVTDKKLNYPAGRSRVVYIGMTEAGVHRVAKSAAERATDILERNGVTSFSARIVHYPTVPKKAKAKLKQRPALLLERALLMTFRDMYGGLPKCNGTGSKMRGRFQVRSATPGLMD